MTLGVRTRKGQKGIFWCDGNVLYLGLGDGLECTYTFVKIHGTVPLRFVHRTVYKDFSNELPASKTVSAFPLSTLKSIQMHTQYLLFPRCCAKSEKHVDKHFRPGWVTDLRSFQKC